MQNRKIYKTYNLSAVLWKKKKKEQLKSLTGVNEGVYPQVMSEKVMERMRNEDTAERMIRQWNLSVYTKQSYYLTFSENKLKF